MISAQDKLETALGYRFADKKFRDTALTHRSYSHPHYERLEFLGDSVLGLAVSALLYRRFPELPEGDLSRLRAHLVREDSLHRIALSLDLGDCLYLGEGEQKSGGKERVSILADALEALFAAVYLESGFQAASEVIERLFASSIAAIVPGQSLKDPKTRLQEWLQGQKLPLPAYQLLATSGAAHAQLFHVSCTVEAPYSLKSKGQGKSRRLAEQAAAEAVLVLLEAKERP
ncbi:MAG: ribonuclease III [Betaproteobacteria bacterium]|nr:ribonuclease III [Betaproteobacteria bacterium]